MVLYQWDKVKPGSCMGTKICFSELLIHPPIYEIPKKHSYWIVYRGESMSVTTGGQSIFAPEDLKIGEKICHVLTSLYAMSV